MMFKFALLGVLGLVAAGAAAVLMASMQAQPEAADAQGPQEITVVVAKGNLAPLTRIQQENVELRSVIGLKTPTQYFSDPVEVVGQVLAISMVDGQGFTSASFAPDGPGVQLASTLPHGMRAMTISVSEHAGLSGLLYPGSLVDVLSTFRMYGTEGVLSMTLIRGVQVLAIEDRTVVSAPDSGSNRNARSDRRLRVTLMVDIKQAEALQLAMEHGTVTLALRNPIDSADPTPDTDRLTSLADLRSGTLWEALRMLEEEESHDPAQLAAGGPAAPVEAPPPPDPEPVPAPAVEPAPTPEPAPEIKVIPQWHTLILRGGNAVTRSFELAEDDGAVPANPRARSDK